MVEYLTDIKINRDRDIHLDDSNDLALISGERNLEQSIGIVASDAIDKFVGSTITGTSIGLLEERLLRYLDRDPHVENVREVEVTEFDRRTETISMEALLEETETLPLEVFS